MKINVKHPSFITFMEMVLKTISSSITLTNYFQLSPEKKLGIQYMTFKILKKSLKNESSLTDEDIKMFIKILNKKSAESELYELSEVLKDIENNFDSINDVTKPAKNTNKPIKIVKE